MYGSVALADAYFDKRLHNWDWKNSNHQDKKAALHEASDLIDQFDFIDEKADEDQDREFPRTGETEAPKAILQATYLIAQALLSGRDPEQDLENKTITNTRFGQLMSARDTEGNTLEHLSHLIPSPLAWNLIRPYLRERTSFDISRI